VKVRNKKKSLNVITLGCSKNLVDSENLITQLSANDLQVRHDSDGTDHDVVIINTCGFIDRAKEESVDTILEYSKLKQQGDISELYVMGCLSERYREDLQREIPDVDGYFGTTELPQILSAVGVEYRDELLGERITTTPAHYAYLKIAEGCNRTCSFCAIPLMRGKHISQSIEQLVAQARAHARAGVRELILISQELTYYGLDLYKRRALVDLLIALEEVDGIDWIRLHYAYPSKFPREILDHMASSSKVCSYLDMPLQHISDTVLKRMRRQITRSDTQELIDYARATVPNLTLRTTMLVGHPGETNAEFDELCDFVSEGHFDRLGVFQYSHEEDTSAHDMPDDVPASLKEMRAQTLMEIQSSISLRHNESLVGKTLRVLIDDRVDGKYRGRTEGDSPEVDNEVWVEADYLRVGDFYDAVITDASEYDLFATVNK